MINLATDFINPFDYYTEMENIVKEHQINRVSKEVVLPEKITNQVTKHYRNGQKISKVAFELVHNKSQIKTYTPQPREVVSEGGLKAANITIRTYYRNVTEYQALNKPKLVRSVSLCTLIIAAYFAVKLLNEAAT